MFYSNSSLEYNLVFDYLIETVQLIQPVNINHLFPWVYLTKIVALKGFSYMLIEMNPEQPLLVHTTG